MSVVAVAAGVLRRADGCVLIAQRPAGKIAAGRWEFPGGKIEPGERPREALIRELREELGIEVREARPLIRIRHAYTERTVELDTWLVEAWSGTPAMLEDQALAWVDPARIWDYDLLEADSPIVHALRLPDRLPVTAANADASALQAGILALAEAGRALIRLRAPTLPESRYWQLVHSVGPTLEDRGAGLLVDRWREDLAALAGVAGLHLPAAALTDFSRRPVGRDRWLLASCHDERELDQACTLDADALVIGPVLPTATHPDAPALGWAGFEALARRANRPVYAIGGLGPEHLGSVFDHGGQGIAGIRAFWPD